FHRISDPKRTFCGLRFHSRTEEQPRNPGRCHHRMFNEKEQSMKSTAHGNHNFISSNDVQGTNVYGPGEDKVGTIDHLMIDKVSGRVHYAVMSFGGFLGLGHSHYPIPWPAL